MEKSAPIHVTILGGGIAGLAVAIGLARQNLPFTVYEAAPELGTVGAGIALGPNTVSAMKLIDPALRDMYDGISLGNPSPSKKHVFADFLLAEPGFGTKRGFTGAEVGASVFTKSGAHRKDLLGGMERLLSGQDVRFGKRATGVQQDGAKVRIEFQDGEVIETDAVIGCDGGKGITRAAVLGSQYPEHIAPAYSGRYVYRAILPPGKAQEILGEYAGNGKIFLGKHTYFAMYQLSEGRFNFLAGKQSSEPWVHPQWTCEVTKEEMLADFDGCDPRLVALLQWTQPVRWGLFHHVTTPTYYNERIALVGDVAHASTPHQGSGAGQCFEDALVLSYLLGKVRDDSDLNAAFQVYDSICRPRGQEIVRTSDEAGRLFTFSHPEYGDDIVRIVENANQRFLWIWTHELEADLERADAEFKRLQEEQSINTS